MLSVYPACFYEEEDGRYSVIFPDLNHLATFGNDLNDAMNMAVDCLASYLFELKISKETAPHPSDMTSIDINAEYDEYKNVFINMVSVDVEEYANKNFKKAVKKTLTIPAWMNAYVVEYDINCSAVLQKEIGKIIRIIKRKERFSQSTVVPQVVVRPDTLYKGFAQISNKAGRPKRAEVAAKKIPKAYKKGGS